MATTKTKLLKQFWWLPFLALTFSVPVFVKGSYYLDLLITVILNCVNALGLWLVVSTGQLSIAQAAFMAIGAYTSSLLTLHTNISFWLAFLISGILASFIAILIGIPSLRIKGVYFAILTFAFGEVLRLLLVGLVVPFGGANGLSGIPHPEPLRFPGGVTFQVRAPGDYYVLALILMLLTIFVVLRLVRSPFGMNSRAIEASDYLAASVGINVMRHKVTAFAIAGLLSGFAGSIYAHYLHYIAPEFFSFFESIDYLVFILVGGRDFVVGPIIGSVVFTLLPHILGVVEQYRLLIYGVILIVVMVFLPNGLASFGWRVGAFILKKAGREKQRNDFTPNE